MVQLQRFNKKMRHRARSKEDATLRRVVSLGTQEIAGMVDKKIIHFDTEQNEHVRVEVDYTESILLPEHGKYKKHHYNGNTK